jgi:phospholipase C
VPCLIISPWTVGGNIYSTVADHTSCLQFLERVTAANGLSAHGPVTFNYISRWRRATFDDFQGALVPGTAQAAPANFQAIVNGSADLPNGETINTYVTNQNSSANLALPPFPGASQTTPTQV